MIDSQTGKAIRVSMDRTGGPYIMVTVNQVSRIREKLNHRSISHWVDSDAISLDGKPAVTFINFGRSEDAKKIQAILDDAD